MARPQKAQKHVTFAQQLATYAHFEIQDDSSNAIGTVVPHMPSPGALSAFLDTVRQAAEEADPKFPGLRQWAQNILEDMSLGWVTFGLARLPANLFLAFASCAPRGGWKRFA